MISLADAIAELDRRITEYGQKYSSADTAREQGFLGAASALAGFREWLEKAGADPRPAEVERRRMATAFMASLLPMAAEDEHGTGRDWAEVAVDAAVTLQRELDRTRTTRPKDAET